MQFLREINTIRLSDIQKLILLMAHTAATPRLAREFINGKIHFIQAADFLSRYNMIQLTESELSITEIGKNQLIQYNLIDDTDELTDEGQNLLDSSSDYATYFPA